VFYRPAFFSVLILAIVLLVSNCVFLKPASTPIPSKYYNYSDSNSTLVLLLPGFGDSPTSFIKHGTVEQIMACRPNSNILGVDSHFAYFRNSTLVERLHEDIIKPASDAHMQNIWIMGISMGGLGSLLYQLQHPDEIEAVVVMAPYIGEWDELNAYRTGQKSLRESTNPVFIKLWDGLTNISLTDPAITLAFGEDDKANKQLRWFASLLDEIKVVRTSGGHRWTVWNKLWPETLRRSGLCDLS
jgi:pimeloyl-ACP methyl ester carboxylesterase